MAEEPSSKFTTYVPIASGMRELTFKTLVLGIWGAVILGAANAYWGFKVGTTVAATLPAAVIAMAVLRPFEGTILEENLTRQSTVENTGLLLASGLVAGQALTGILLAAVVVSNINPKTAVGLAPDFNGYWWLGVIVYVILAYVLIHYPLKRLQQK